MARLRRWLLIGAAGALARGAAPADAQEHAGHGAEATRPWAVGAQAVGLVTHASPAMAGRSLTEAYLTQTALGGHVSLGGGRVSLQGMLNLEGLTLRRGELNAGIWGEGYVDRRHPHTLLHEAMGSVRVLDAPRAALSLSLGRGFAPFGTDDPMVRPMVKYPANHHLSQVLERLVAVAALRAGPVALEAGAFNGDEPTGPGSLGTPGRFGDSWATRLTLLPRAGLEVQASVAMLESPDLPLGGLDHWKRSASVRYAPPRHGDEGPYVMLEWARTELYDDGRRGPGFGTVLGEGALRRGPLRLALRVEQTDRPEEDRLLDPFRTPQPHADVHLLGITRWRIVTAALSAPAPALGPLRARPFLEVSRSSARELRRPSFFVPADVYGADRMWSVSIGARLWSGMTHTRMGRYGVALPAPQDPT